MILRADLRAAAVLLAVSALACEPSYEAPAQPDAWTGGEGHRWRALRIEREGRPAGFTPIPDSWSGVDFANRLSDGAMIENQMRTNGSGVAAADVDGDGRVDLYFARLEGPNALYRNLGDWRFEERAAESGLAAGDRFSTGVTFADVDGDGDPDLILTAVGGPNSVFINDGRGRFEELADAGLEGGRGSMSTALADIDGDGDLDLYVTNYKAASVLDLFPPLERTFSKTVIRQNGEYVVSPAFREHYELEWRAGELGRLEIGEGDELYLNDGTGRFTLSGFEAGRFTAADGSPITEAPREWGLAARFGDLDDDGDADLYVCNDLHSPDRIWLNRGDGTFREIEPLAIRTTSGSSMAVDFSDIERDGDLDIFTADMLSRSTRLRKTQVPVQDVDRTLPGAVSRRQQVARNALLVNRGDGTYAELARFAGVEASDWTWSVLFVDVDLDGYEDLLLPNGHTRDMMDADAQTGFRNTFLTDWREGLLLYRPLPIRNVAFRNRGDLGFEEVGEAWGFGSEPDISHGAASVDLDGDGDLDIVVNRLHGPALLLRNDAEAPRLAVRLRGEAPNGFGVGAVVRVRGHAAGEQRKEIAAGGGYLSGFEPIAAFAAGGADSLEILVDWPSGARSNVPAARPDRLYEIFESGAAPRPPGRPEAPAAPPAFELVEGFVPRHDEPPFDEFARQPLLPLRLGQLGPGAAWHDFDADGDPDLAIGSGRGSEPILFRNDGGSLRRVAMRIPPPPFDQTALLPLPDGEGATALWIGLSSYEAETPGAAREAAAAIRFDFEAGALSGSQVSPPITGAVPGGEAATGALAAADVDGDGLLDLFVAGRVVPGRYPLAGPSRLFAGVPGRGFGPTSLPLPADLGLVAGATFSDLDADGDPDLVLAEDWGPVRILWNDGGRLVERPGRSAIGPAGRWNAVATGDLDSDGRPDIIATSWGRNTEYHASDSSPLRLYAADLDRNGTLELIEAFHDPRLGAWTPRVSFERLRRGYPPLGERVGSFAEYADADLSDLFGDALDGAAVFEATELDHTLFLNRGDRFEARPLPAQAQWAPSFGVAVADLDGDGHEDVVLAQNFYATDPDSPRYDAGRGLWLRGDGEGGLEPVPAHRSGIVAWGDQRAVALADHDLDGRVDILITQNGSEARLFRNRGARPGLRVRLIGPAENAYAIGSAARILYADGAGPVREVKAGGGHLSHDEPVPVLGLAREPKAVEVRWPGGEMTRVDVPAGALEVVVRHPGAPEESP